jgi:alkylation response protein AidB-like acyl-CoA dehydrogenase
MNFAPDAQAEAFRAEVRAFLRAHLPPEMAARTLRGYHGRKDDMIGWTRILHAHGWSAPHWPREHGGPGWTPLQRHLFEEECALAGAPPTCVSAFMLVAPVIQHFGTPAQQAQHLPPILRGDTWWGQGFSEPNAGSDLASLKTRAVRTPDGEHYLVNGQKTWTTEGHHADWFFCLVRTNPEAKPQRGISFLLIDAKSPGITLRPIVSIDGAHSLNEVFFDDVRVPAANRVGDEGQGWSCAKFLLDNERAFSAELPRNKRMLARLQALAATLPSDPALAREIAEVEAELAALEMLTLRALAEQGSERVGAWPGGSILHVLGSELQQKTGALLVRALAERSVVELPADLPLSADPAPGITADFLYRRAVTIYGGSNEIQRNLIARYWLGA